MKYGLFFLVVSVLLTFEAATSGGWGYAVLWPAVSFGAAGAAYLGLGSAVFGKRPDGTISVAARLLLLPYRVYALVLWHLQRLFLREPAFQRLARGILIGRRLLASEYPPGVSTVIDLTCEFGEPEAARRSRDYRSFPVLDGGMPDVERLLEFLGELSSPAPDIFIHCANGHGRTATFSACWLIFQGMAADAEDAIRMIRRARPKAGMNRCQRQFLEAFVNR